MAATQIGGPGPGRNQLIPGMHAPDFQPYQAMANVSDALPF